MSNRYVRNTSQGNNRISRGAGGWGLKPGPKLVRRCMEETGRVGVARELFSKAAPLPLGCFPCVSRWEQALEAYERARDMDSVVRLCLDQLDRADRAFAIVRENASRWVMLMVMVMVMVLSCIRHGQHRSG